MSKYRLSPSQYVFIEKVLKSQAVPVIDCTNFVSLVESITKARQADDGLVYVELSPGDIQIFLGFLSETTIKVKDIDFILSIVTVLKSNTGLSLSRPSSGEAGQEGQLSSENFDKGENNGL
jgi:hypothetical protein